MEHSVSWFGKKGNTHLFDFGSFQVWVHVGGPFRVVLGLGAKNGVGGKLVRLV